MSYVLLDNQFLTTDEQQVLMKFCIRSGKLTSGPIRSLENRIRL